MEMLQLYCTFHVDGDLTVIPKSAQHRHWYNNEESSKDFLLVSPSPPELGFTVKSNSSEI
jgi:quercetin dioxygenase-like cupin family protein